MCYANCIACYRIDITLTLNHPHPNPKTTTHIKRIKIIHLPISWCCNGILVYVLFFKYSLDHEKKCHRKLNKENFTEKAGSNDFCWTKLVLNTHTMFLQAFCTLKYKPWITCKFYSMWLIELISQSTICTWSAICCKSVWSHAT